MLESLFLNKGYPIKELKDIPVFLVDIIENAIEVNDLWCSTARNCLYQMKKRDQVNLIIEIIKNDAKKVKKDSGKRENTLYYYVKEELKRVQEISVERYKESRRKRKEEKKLSFEEWVKPEKSIKDMDSIEYDEWVNQAPSYSFYEMYFHGIIPSIIKYVWDKTFVRNKENRRKNKEDQKRKDEILELVDIIENAIEVNDLWCSTARNCLNRMKRGEQGGLIVELIKKDAEREKEEGGDSTNTLYYYIKKEMKGFLP